MSRGLGKLQRLILKTLHDRSTEWLSITCLLLEVVPILHPSLKPEAGYQPFVWNHRWIVQRSLDSLMEKGLVERRKDTNWILRSRGYVYRVIKPQLSEVHGIHCTYRSSPGKALPGWESWGNEVPEVETVATGRTGEVYGGLEDESGAGGFRRSLTQLTSVTPKQAAEAEIGVALSRLTTLLPPSKPLLVVWLCPRCHVVADRVQVVRAGEVYDGLDPERGDKPHDQKDSLTELTNPTSKQVAKAEIGKKEALA